MPGEKKWKTMRQISQPVKENRKSLALQGSSSSEISGENRATNKIKMSQRLEITS